LGICADAEAILAFSHHPYPFAARRFDRFHRKQRRGAVYLHAILRSSAKAFHPAPEG
jgi:hypothetical protein